MTVQQLINLALRDIGALGQGETPASSESDDALSTLNHILSSWNLERQTCYSRAASTFTIGSGDDAYTLGPAGDWATTARVARVVAAIASTGAFSQGLEVLDIGAYGKAIGNNAGISAALPQKMGVDHGSPLCLVRLWPKPSGASSIEIFYWSPLAQFAALSDTVSLADGLEFALRTELAITLAPSFGAPVTQELAANRERSKARIRQLAAEIEGVPPQQAVAAPQPGA